MKIVALFLTLAMSFSSFNVSNADYANESQRNIQYVNESIERGTLVSVDNTEDSEADQIDVDEEFIKDSEVSITSEGCLKLTKSELDSEKTNQEMESVVLVPNNEEVVEEAANLIADIKSGKASDLSTENFITSVSSIGENGEGSFENCSSYGWNNRSTSAWSTKVTLKVKYKMKTIHGKEAIKLKKVVVKIKNGTYSSVDSYQVTLGCSGTSTSSNGYHQSKNCSYGAVRAASSQKKVIKPKWKYIYAETYAAKVGANVTVNVKSRNNRSKSGYSRRTLTLVNNIY